MIRDGWLADFDPIDAFDPFAGDRRSELAQGRCLVAIIDERVVGYVSFSQDGFIGQPFVHFLAVAPEYRRRGVALQLLQAVKDRVQVGRLFISTEEDNWPMLSLLKRTEWIEAGCVRGVNQNGTAECFFFCDLGAYR